MSQAQIYEPITPEVKEKIVSALGHFASEGGDMELAEEHGTRRGERLYVRVRPTGEPPMFAFYHAVAGAEIELRDQGINIILTPEYRQKFIVVANVLGHPKPYIYESKDGAEYEDLASLLGKGATWENGTATIEGYPFYNEDDRKSAWQAALSEFPTAVKLP